MSWLAASNRLFLDLFFPKRCVGCGSEGAWICAQCGIDLCAKGAFLKREIDDLQVLSLFNFDYGVIREALHTLKYNGVKDIASELGELLTLNYSKKPELGEAVLIPVPISKPRLKTRGYNQAEELAEAVGHWLGIPVWNGALKRQGKTKTQVGKSVVERATEKGFVWANQPIPEEYKQRDWVLLDDLVTTGNTLLECFNILKEHTTRRVSALTIAAK